MEAKSPTASVKSREIIGVEQFSQRREVFDKYDTVFLPLPSATNMLPDSPPVEPIDATDRDKDASNFKRNIPGYSSMRETRTEENHFDFRPRKYSDNFTSELNQEDDVNYRYSMMERTRRLSKLRRDFLTSNLHEPTNENPFARVGTRSSMPARSGSARYKIESPNLYKFPFAEPYATPTPVRKVILDLGPVEIEEQDKIDDTDGKENQDPETRPKHQSSPNNNNTSKIDHQKLFEELVKRYSPQRKPIDWKLPPTRPRVVGSVPKSSSSVTESVDSVDSKKNVEENLNKSEDDEVFDKIGEKVLEDSDENIVDPNRHIEVIQNGLDALNEETAINENDKKERESKISLTELAEKNDEVPELTTIQRQLSKESAKKAPLETITDLSIPALIEKMTVEGEDFENHKKETKKVKRKRSFLDKLLGRKKDK